MSRIITLPDLEFFRSILAYEPDTGLFRWRRKRNSRGGPVFPGDIAGTPKDGYVQISIEGRQYRAHILAWLFMTGENVPAGFELDHINRNRADNRWANLRLVKRTRNNHNSAPSKSNKSGVKGVSWAKRNGKWDARIRVSGRLYLLGQFESFEDAVAARRDAEHRMVGEYAIRGDVPTSAAYIPEIEVKKEPTPEMVKAWTRRKAITKRSTNTSGHPGVRLHKASGRWHARIVVNYREISLGYFDKFEDAVSARKRAEAEHHGTNEE